MENIENKEPEVKLDGSKVKQSFSLFVNKSKDFFQKIFTPIKNSLSKVNWQKFKLPAIILLSLFCVAEVVFGIIIYGFKVDNRATALAGKIVPYPVAVANYDFVTYEDYLFERNYIHHFYQSTNQDSVNYKEIDSQIIDQLVENEIVSYEALRNNVKLNQSDVDSTINSIVDQNGGQDKVGQVLNDLYGLNLKQFTTLVRTQMLRDKLSTAMIVKIQASHILIRVDQNASQADVDAAKAKIDDVQKQINSGSITFADAAKKYSEDTGSATNGGQLDPFSKGDMVDAFYDAAYNTPVGSISAPVRSEYGWHIIQVQSKTGKINMSFADWLAQIKSKSLILKFYKI